MLFHVEITADDRMAYELHIENRQLKGTRLRYEAFFKTQKVNVQDSRFEPYFMGQWHVLVRYDGTKTPTYKVVIHPAQGRLGVQVREELGNYSPLGLLQSAKKDMLINWYAYRKAYEGGL